MTGPERRVPAAATKSLEVSAGLTVTGIESVGPFGTPDGARADFDTVVNDFVDFEGNAAYGALPHAPTMQPFVSSWVGSALGRRYTCAA